MAETVAIVMGFLLLKGKIACSFCMVRHDLEHNQLILCMLDKYAAGSMQRHASESVHANIPGNSVLVHLIS
jgi:hypothetical protein